MTLSTCSPSVICSVAILICLTTLLTSFSAWSINFNITSTSPYVSMSSISFLILSKYSFDVDGFLSSICNCAFNPSDMVDINAATLLSCIVSPLILSKSTSSTGEYISLTSLLYTMLSTPLFDCITKH